MHQSEVASVVVFTRVGCHLCDDALEILKTHGLLPETVDDDSDAALAAEFGNCVPVVAVDGRVRFRGRVNPILLRRLLRGTGRAQTDS
ncbi:MAG: glutaredoxin family protein [Pirellulales bacterium]